LESRARRGSVGCLSFFIWARILVLTKYRRPNSDFCGPAGGGHHFMNRKKLSPALGFCRVHKKSPTSTICARPVFVSNRDVIPRSRETAQTAFFEKRLRPEGSTWKRISLRLRLPTIHASALTARVSQGAANGSWAGAARPSARRVCRRFRRKQGI